MAVIRNNTSAQHAYLDAARANILAVGVKRTTLTDIARRAGVARMTLYRSWPDMMSLLGDLMTREWVEAADKVAADEDDPSAPAATRIVTRVCAIAQTMRENALLQKVIDVDPEFLLPYVLNRRGRTQDQWLHTVVELVASGHDDGSIRAGDPDLIARAILLATMGFILSMPTMTDTADPADLHLELRVLLERYLSA